MSKNVLKKERNLNPSFWPKMAAFRGNKQCSFVRTFSLVFGAREPPPPLPTGWLPGGCRVVAGELEIHVFLEMFNQKLIKIKKKQTKRKKTIENQFWDLEIDIFVKSFN